MKCSCLPIISICHCCILCSPLTTSLWWSTTTISQGGHWIAFPHQDYLSNRVIAPPPPRVLDSLREENGKGAFELFSLSRLLRLFDFHFIWYYWWWCFLNDVFHNHVRIQWTVVSSNSGYLNFMPNLSIPRIGPSLLSFLQNIGPRYLMSRVFSTSDLIRQILWWHSR